MRLNGLYNIRRSAVVEEKDPLTCAPKRGRSELISLRGSLDDVIGQAWSHMMHQQIGKEVGRYVIDRDRCRCRDERLCVAETATNRVELSLPICGPQSHGRQRLL